jgi:hypothetical protein
MYLGICISEFLSMYLETISNLPKDYSLTYVGSIVDDHYSLAARKPTADLKILGFNLDVIRV